MIVAVGVLAVRAAQKATGAIPIVFPLAGDAERIGLVASLARPGGNTTGLSTMGGELSRKRLELLKEAIPGLARVAVLSNPANPVHAPALNDLQAAAVAMGVQLQLLAVKEPEEYERAFSAMTGMRVQAVLLLPDEMLNARRAQVVGLAARSRLPSIGYAIEGTVEGGLMSYAVHVPSMFRRAASYVDKILKGAKPGDLPVEQPAQFELVINLKTAKALGLTLPRSFLQRADRLIE